MVFEGVNKSLESFDGWIVWKLNLLDIFFPLFSLFPLFLSDFSIGFLPAEQQVLLNSSALTGGSDRCGPYAGWLLYTIACVISLFGSNLEGGYFIGLGKKHLHIDSWVLQ